MRDMMGNMMGNMSGRRDCVGEGCNASGRISRIISGISNVNTYEVKREKERCEKERERRGDGPLVSLIVAPPSTLIIIAHPTRMVGLGVGRPSTARKCISNCPTSHASMV